MNRKIASALFVAVVSSGYGMTTSQAVPIAPPSVQVAEKADALQLVARRYYHRRGYGGRVGYGHRYGYRGGVYRGGIYRRGVYRRGVYGAYGAYGAYGVYGSRLCPRRDDRLGYNCNYGYPSYTTTYGLGSYGYRRYGYHRRYGAHVSPYRRSYGHHRYYRRHR
jgi:hypothetical protein